MKSNIKRTVDQQPFALGDGGAHRNGSIEKGYVLL